MGTKRSRQFTNDEVEIRFKETKKSRQSTNNIGVKGQRGIVNLPMARLTKWFCRNKEI